MVSSALIPEVWEQELEFDVDKDFLLEGIKNGFRIRNLDIEPKEVEQENYNSATNKDVHDLVESQILTEIQEGRYVVTNIRPKIVSALGAIRKSDSNDVRLIHDASKPTGFGLNDYASIFDKQSFQSIDEAEKLMTPSSYFAKVDLKSAYRYVKISEKDYNYTGLKWKFAGNTEFTYMYDTRLPFGSRLAPGIFHRITQSVKRSMARRGYDIMIVYLDDFLIISESKLACQQCLECLLGLLRKLGWAISWSKVEGPTKIIKFLGIILDSNKMQLELPANKVGEFQQLVETTLNRKRLSLKQLQSLAGKLNWASGVIRGGRTFLRRILDAMLPLKASHHKIVISSDMIADLMWWRQYLRIFNGKALALHAAVPTHSVATDACNAAAGMAYNGDWSYVNWLCDFPQVADWHINYKETLAIIIASFRWAPMWKNSHVQVFTDNVTAKAIINKGTSRNPSIMPFIRRLFWLSAFFNFKITAKYIPGSMNCLADTVSRLHEDGQIFVLESYLRPPGSAEAYDIKLPMHASIGGILFLHSQMLRWLHWKRVWMKRSRNTEQIALLPPPKNLITLTEKSI